MQKGIRKMQRHTACAALILAMVFIAVLWGPDVSAQPEHAKGAAPVDPQSAKWAFIAAALSVGLGCLGAGIAVAYVGSAAVGAVAEKPQLAARTLIFVGLAEGIAIYGLIIAIMLLGKV